MTKNLQLAGYIVAAVILVMVGIVTVLAIAYSQREAPAPAPVLTILSCPPGKCEMLV